MCFEREHGIAGVSTQNITTRIYQILAQSHWSSQMAFSTLQCLQCHQLCVPPSTLQTKRHRASIAMAIRSEAERSRGVTRWFHHTWGWPGWPQFHQFQHCLAGGNPKPRLASNAYGHVVTCDEVMSTSYGVLLMPMWRTEPTVVRETERERAKQLIFLRYKFCMQNMTHAI